MAVQPAQRTPLFPRAIRRNLPTASHGDGTHRPLAAVVLKEGATATPEELRAFLAKSFAKWQLPDAFVFLPEIPRTSVGKFKKTALREQFANWNWDA